MKYLIILSILITIVSCNRSEFLDAQPNSTIVIPTTAKELLAMLDYNQMNATNGLPDYSSDEYYVVSATVLNSQTAFVRNAFVWNEEIYDGNSDDAGWNTPYHQIMVANIVLAAFTDASAEDQAKLEWRALKGYALFYRAYANYHLVLSYAKQYDAETASTDPGIPLRTTADVNRIAQRASIQEVFNAVFSDINEALNFLPEQIQFNNRNRPSKVAAYALLSRIHLNRGEYQQSLSFADASLAIYNKLLNFNLLNLTAAIPFDRNNPEVIFASAVLSTTFIYARQIARNTLVDSTLYATYESGDLRKNIYFATPAGRPILKGTYTIDGLNRFSGLAVDEVIMNKIECLARLGQLEEAIAELNALLKTRWSNEVPFQPYVASTSENTLDLILLERRKELVARGLRWYDLKRLNKEGRNIVIRRVIEGVETVLLPNSPRYVFPIPPNEIAVSGIEQNIR